MRRDICCLFDKPLPEVFDAYVKAAKTLFDQNAGVECYHTIKIGLKYSFKYNMNGGECLVHFIPWENGTAVNVRYVMVQLFGAKYEAHYKDLLCTVEKILCIKSKPASIDMELFTKSESKVYSLNDSRLSNLTSTTFVNAEPQSASAQNREKNFKFCTQCGAKLESNALFCSACGKKQN